MVVFGISLRFTLQFRPPPPVFSRVQEDDEQRGQHSHSWRGVRKTAQNQKITVVPDVTAAAGLDGRAFDAELSFEEQQLLHSLRQMWLTCECTVVFVVVRNGSFEQPVRPVRLQTNRDQSYRSASSSCTPATRIRTIWRCACTPTVATRPRRRPTVWPSAVSVLTQIPTHVKRL